MIKLNNKNYIEKKGRFITMLSTLIVIIVVISIIFMVTLKGMAAFIENKVSIIDFLFSTNWSPSKGLVGAFPMIFGSFIVTIFATIVATPLSLGAAIFVVEINKKLGSKILQPAIELLVGIPSVIYGLVGLFIVVPFIRKHFGGTGFGLLTGIIILTIMVLPTITSLSIDALSAVDNSKREGALALGVTRWQMVSGVIIKAALPGILTAIVLGMARAFGEALAIQMIIGNTTIMPKSILSPASTLTSILTMSMGNTIPGQLENNILWSLALVLMLTSLLFILIIHYIGRKKIR